MAAERCTHVGTQVPFERIRCLRSQSRMPAGIRYDAEEFFLNLFLCNSCERLGALDPVKVLAVVESRHQSGHGGVAPAAGKRLGGGAAARRPSITKLSDHSRKSAGVSSAGLCLFAVADGPGFIHQC